MADRIIQDLRMLNLMPAGFPIGNCCLYHLPTRSQGVLRHSRLKQWKKDNPDKVRAGIAAELKFKPTSLM